MHGSKIIPQINYIEEKILAYNANISYISGIAGEDYSVLLDDCGSVYSFGTNTKNQLLLGNEFISDEINVIKNFQNKVKEIKCDGNRHIILNNEDKLYISKFTKYEKNELNNKIFKRNDLTTLYVLNFNINNKINITNISCGASFTIILTKQGVLYSFGSNNKHGELGLGDNYPRKEPEMIKHLIACKERILQVQCGYKHVLAIGSTGKVYAWGNVSIQSFFYI